MTLPATSIRVFVVEDHPVMREMLCEAVERAPQCILCGATGTAEAALAQLVSKDVDLVLVDVSLPRMSGIDLVRALGEQRPELVCLMVSGHVDDSYAAQALDAGARGYILKGRPDDLVDGIRAAIAGNVFLSKPLEDKLGAG